MDALGYALAYPPLNNGALQAAPGGSVGTSRLPCPPLRAARSPVDDEAARALATALPAAGVAATVSAYVEGAYPAHFPSGPRPTRHHGSGIPHG